RKANMLGERDGNIGAESVEGAVRQVDDAADAEDQGEPERDQKVVAAENEAIHHLCEQEHILSQRHTGTRDAARHRLHPAFDHKLQGFCSLVGARASSGSLAAGTAAPSAMISHRSLAWPFGLTVNG